MLCVLGFTLRSGLLQVILDARRIGPLAGSVICGPLWSLISRQRILPLPNLSKRFLGAMRSRFDYLPEFYSAHIAE